jgi:hypothetical protein
MFGPLFRGGTGRLPSELQNKRNASRSKRVMRRERGAQPETVKARRFERAERAQRYRFS